MFWRWFQEWRDRRSALSGFRERRRDEEAELSDHVANPLNLAKLCLDRGEFATAAMHWERARSLMPLTVMRSHDSLDVLLGLKRYDEAEALMRERGTRVSGDRFHLIGLARVAEQRGDIEEALTRWMLARDRVRDSVDGYLGCIRCLLLLDRLEEADDQCGRAIRIDPLDIHAWLERARISDRRGDIATSLDRWKHLAETFKYPPACAFAARAMAELGHADAAEVYLHEAVLLYPNDLEVAVARAHFAKRRGDLPAVCDRWASVRAIAPFFVGGYQEGAEFLIEAERYAEADAVLQSAISRFPAEPWPLRDHASLAHEQRNWDAAVERWATLRRLFPEEQMGFSKGAEALHAAGRFDEANALKHGS